MNIDVAAERDGNALVLLPVGRLDSANARSFEQVVMEHIEEVFRISGFDQIIPIKTSRGDAVRAV